MKGLWMMRWVGLAAVAGGMFMTFSDLMNLTIYVPGLKETAHTGYQVVGSGVLLLALTLLFVGIVGLFAGSPRPGGPRVIEYGDASARYVLVEEWRDDAGAKAPGRGPGQPAPELPSAAAERLAARRHRTDTTTPGAWQAARSLG